jgi:competence protein ComEA
MKLCLPVFLGVLGLLPALKAQDLPPGEGKEALQKICTSCHGLETVTDSRRTRADWENVVNNMASNGASGTDAEFDQIITYLAKNFGPAKVNINKSTSADLVGKLRLTQAEADAVVQYRTKNGDFKSFDDLKKVAAVDSKKLDAAKDRLEY